ncbi:WSC-domain-containing protein [Apiospora phragmitis]|uniref:WSC-domain-containing protein n=1 Tax=Apiospora phragmitis TaxID=2905665 RepID=A0ABR1USD0_9PEZI
MPDPFTLLGCFVDQSPNRTLAHTAFQGHDTNCALVCHDICNTPQYQATYFGLEYGTECYCGSGDLAAFPRAGSPAECNKPCPANASEMCGSDWRLSLYRILDTTVDPSSSPTATPGPSSTLPNDNSTTTTDRGHQRGSLCPSGSLGGAGDLSDAAATAAGSEGTSPG